MAATVFFEVSESESGERIDRFLARRAAASHRPELGALSRQRLQQLVTDGEVIVSGSHRQSQRALLARDRVKAGWSVMLRVPAPKASDLIPSPMPLNVIHEDEHLLVLNKSAHQVVHPGAGTRGPTLVEGLLAHCRSLSGIGGIRRPGIVHRLDAPTTGLLVVAKDDVTHQALCEQFAARSVEKRYLALVVRSSAVAHRRYLQPFAVGPALWRHWSAPIGRHATDRKRFTSMPPFASPPRTASTLWRVLGQDTDLMLLALVLNTGRTHQIRVHAADTIGPIVGDAMYRPKVARRPLETGPHCEGLKSLDHHALHAGLLAFVHPHSGKPLRFSAPPPESWCQTACALGPALAWCRGDEALAPAIVSPKTL